MSEEGKRVLELEDAPPSPALPCATCGHDLVPGDRVIQFLDGLLTPEGGMEDVTGRQIFHYECFFPEEPEAEATDEAFDQQEDER